MRKEELKKQYFLLFIVIAAVTAFAFAMVGLLDSHAQMNLEQRQDVYGGWHVGIYDATDDIYKKIHNHAIVEEVGKMEVYGYVESFYGEKEHPVGSIDDITKDMGRITLVSGEMPDEKGEVAIEMDTLAALGYSYEPGQAITLKINGVDSFGRITTRQESFMLTGVVHNYSDVWKNSGNDLINIFIIPDYKQSFDVQSINYFLKIKDKYISNITEMKILVNEGKFVENNYIFNEDTNEISLVEEFLQEEIFVFLVIILSVIMLVVLISTMINRRRESFALIRSIGGERKQIVTALIYEIVPVIIAGILVGTLVGITLPAVIFKVLANFFEGMIFMIKPVHAGIIALGVLVGSFFACMIGIIGIFRVPMRGTIKYQTMGKGRNVRRRENFLSLFATFCMGCVFITSWYFCYLEYFEYQSFNKLYPYDYKFGYLPDYSEVNVNISKETYEEIKQCYGVEYARAYKISPYYEIEWDGRNESEYARKVSAIQNPHLPREKQSIDKIYTRVYEVGEDDERAFQDYQKQIDKGQITYDEVQNSNKVIIYLPVLYEYEEGKIVTTRNHEYWLQKKTVNIWNNDTINIGDKIKILGEFGESEVEVAAIIYDEQINSRIPIRMPYTIVSGKYVGEKVNCIESFMCIEVYGKDNANQLKTEAELGKFQNINIEFEKKTTIKSTIFNRMLFHIGIIGIMSVIVFALLIVFKWKIVGNQITSEKNRNQIFYTLGVTKSRLLGNYIFKELSVIIVCFIFSVVGSLYYLVGRDYSDRYQDFSYYREDFISIVSVLYRTVFEKYNMYLCVILGAIYAIIIIIITYRLIKKFIDIK